MWTESGLQRAAIIHGISVQKEDYRPPITGVFPEEKPCIKKV
jgi:hypothetical protein